MADDAYLYQNNKFNINGKPVLVQNSTGIYYGTLEKFDTREGTVLLSNGYSISPQRHITHAQYNQIMNADSMKKDLINPMHHRRLEQQEMFMHSLAKKYKLDVIDYKGVDYDLVRSIATGNTITDYAIEGISRYYTVYDENFTVHGSAIRLTDFDSFTVPFISLTGVSVVIPIDENHELTFHELGNDDEDLGFTMPVLETFIAAGSNSFKWDRGEARVIKSVNGKAVIDKKSAPAIISAEVNGPTLIAFKYSRPSVRSIREREARLRERDIKDYGKGR